MYTQNPMSGSAPIKIQEYCFMTYLTHLKLKEASLFLHLFCDLSPGDLRTDHPMLFGMFPFLLLDFCTVTKPNQTLTF